MSFSPEVGVRLRDSFGGRRGLQLSFCGLGAGIGVTILVGFGLSAGGVDLISSTGGDVVAPKV